VSYLLEANTIRNAHRFIHLHACGVTKADATPIRARKARIFFIIFEFYLLLLIGRKLIYGRVGGCAAYAKFLFVSQHSSRASFYLFKTSEKWFHLLTKRAPDALSHAHKHTCKELHIGFEIAHK